MKDWEFIAGLGGTVSMDVSTGDHDAGHRLFGIITGLEDGVILCELTEDNKDFQPSPARAQLLQAMERYEWVRDDLGGCQSKGCPVTGRTDGTADDCDCCQDNTAAQRMIRAGQELYAALGEYYKNTGNPIMANPVRIKVLVETGFANCIHEDEVFVDRAERDAMSEQERDDFLDEQARELRSNHVSCSAWVAREGEE